MTPSARVRTFAALSATLLLAAGCGPKYLDVRTVAAAPTCTNAAVLTGWSVQLENAARHGLAAKHVDVCA
jgi:hypothetical protein